MSLEKLGWFPFCYVGILLAVDVMFVLISLSPAATSFVNFYKQPHIWALPYILIIIGTISELAFDVALFPIGSNDPDTFLLQNLGYEIALIIAIAWGLILGVYLYGNVMATGQVWIPVPEMLGSGRAMTASSSVRDLFSGYDPVGNALANSLPPTMKENPIFIYWLMMILWAPLKIAGKLLGAEQAFNIIGMLAFVLSATFLFSRIAHAWVYQEVEPYYTKASFFAGACSLGVALTGFPLACMIPHILHNWSASMAATIGLPLIIACVWMMAWPRGLKQKVVGK